MMRITLAALMAVVLVSCGGGAAIDVAPGADASFAADATAAAQRSTKAAPALVAGQVSVVNSSTEGDQTLLTIGATSDGGYVVAWFSAGPALFIQAYDSAGAKAGAQTQIAIDVGARTQSAAALAIEQSSLAVLTDGSVVVVYRVSRDFDLGGGLTESRTGVYFQHFDGAGVLLAPETQVASLPDLGPKSPFIAQASAVPLSEGGFVVAWTVAHYSTMFNSISTLSLRWFDNAGQAVGSPVQVGDFPELTYSIVADTHGGFTLSFARTDNFYRRENDVEHYDASHVFIEVVPPTLSRVLLLPLDDTYVLFSEDGSGATEQLLDAQGVALGAAIPIPAMPSAARELADGTYVTLQPMGNGAFSVDWFDADMMPLGSQLQIGSRGVLPQLASLAEPGFAAAWTGASANQGTDVYTQRFTETLSATKKACLDRAKEQHLTGHARKAFMNACAG
jgi:hypothetical protein